MIGVTTKGLTVVAAGIDVVAIGQAAKQSNESNTYFPVIAETTRVAGGWTGAVIGAQSGAALGFELSQGFGPVAMSACVLSGGAVGSITGYFGVSEFCKGVTGGYYDVLTNKAEYSSDFCHGALSRTVSQSVVVSQRAAKLEQETFAASRQSTNNSFLKFVSVLAEGAAKADRTTVFTAPVLVASVNHHDTAAQDESSAQSGASSVGSYSSISVDEADSQRNVLFPCIDVAPINDAKIGPVVDSSTPNLPDYSSPHGEFYYSSSSGWLVTFSLPLVYFARDPVSATLAVIAAASYVAWSKVTSKKEATAIHYIEKYLFTPQARYLTRLHHLGQQFGMAKTYAEKQQIAIEIHAVYNEGRFNAADSLETIDQRYHGDYKGKLWKSNRQIADGQRKNIYAQYDKYRTVINPYLLSDEELIFLHQNSPDKKIRDEAYYHLVGREVIKPQAEQPSVDDAVSEMPEPIVPVERAPESTHREFQKVDVLASTAVLVQTAEIITKVGFFLTEKPKKIHVSATRLKNGSVVADIKRRNQWGKKIW